MMGEGSLNYRLGRLPGVKYYEGLVRLAQANRIAVPKMESYLKYLRKYQEADLSAADFELGGVEKEIALNLAAGNPAAESLVGTERFLKDRKKFLQDHFSPQDWAAYRQSTAGGRKKEKGWKEIEEDINKEEKRLGLFPSGLPPSRG